MMTTTSALPAFDRSATFGVQRMHGDDLWYFRDAQTYQKTYDDVEKSVLTPWNPTWPIDQRLDWIVMMVAGMAPGSRVLDVGCHMGESLYPIRHRTTMQGVGIDVSPTNVERARANGVDAQVGFAEDLPFADDQFDALILSEILEHVADVNVVLTEGLRVLKPGGMVLITVPFGPWELGNPGLQQFHVREVNVNALLAYGNYHALHQLQYQMDWCPPDQPLGHLLMRFHKFTSAPFIRPRGGA